MNALGIHDSAKQGTALLVVVMLLAAISVLLTSLLTGVHHTLANTHSAWREQVTQTLANAGIQSAAAHLAENSSSYTGEKDVRLGDGFFSVHVSKGDASNQFRVISTGELREGRYTLHRTVVSAQITIANGTIAAIKQIGPATESGAS